MPTEAEWEYSCRARTTTRFHSGDSDDSLKRVARFGLNPSDGTAAVGQLEPNAFGLYDMHGNVWEWCENKSKNSEDHAVLRGGSWCHNAVACRTAHRFRLSLGYRYDFVGFRLAFRLDS